MRLVLRKKYSFYTTFENNYSFNYTGLDELAMVFDFHKHNITVVIGEYALLLCYTICGLLLMWVASEAAGSMSVATTNKALRTRKTGCEKAKLKHLFARLLFTHYNCCGTTYRRNSEATNLPARKDSREFGVRSHDVKKTKKFH